MDTEPGNKVMPLLSGEQGWKVVSAGCLEATANQQGMTCLEKVKVRFRYSNLWHE
ncbi:hypothetical protein OH492_18000 [Vibrio chagasii]|nr:hypothetical protein [Vibrio chagasii]